MTHSLNVFTFLFLFSSSVVFAAGPEWNVFHGPKGDNISPDTGLLRQWGEGTPKLLWKNDKIGDTEFPGYSGAVFADGKIFTSGNVKQDGEEKKAHEFIYALDLNGKELWKYDNGPGWTGHYPGDHSTPTFDGGKVYAFSPQGQLVCLDANTGKEIWKRQVKEEADAKLPNWGYAESPVVDGEKVIVCPGGKKVAVYAVDKLTGKTIWETPGNGDLAGYATVKVVEQDGLKIYFTMNQNKLLGIRAKDGKKLIEYDHPTQYDINATMPYYKDGKVLITAGYGDQGTGAKLLKLTVKGDEASVEQIWHEKKLDNQHGGIIVWDGYIYGAAHKYKGGAWLCLKFDDGAIQWEDRKVGQGSIAFADGRLYLYAEKDGTVALVKPNPEKFEEVSRFQLPEGPGMYWAHPVICGKKLYLRHATVLYCFDIAAK
ncbi:MAG: PQQ-like beta-propeller repeat protein [Planctomycetaceae bacterium]|jgi:outer membrane protein assembly factor BamB|nr:PQQ-like beta-propeller repeat protein [Planctomycetaceae bacterium]